MPRSHFVRRLTGAQAPSASRKSPAAEDDQIAMLARIILNADYAEFYTQHRVLFRIYSNVAGNYNDEVSIGLDRTRSYMKTKDKMIGAGIGLAALAAAGTYFLYGKRGAKNREAIAGWTLQLKGEILEKMEKLKDLNQDTYDTLVEETASRYARTKRIGASELKQITADLKNAWTHIRKQMTTKT